MNCYLLQFDSSKAGSGSAIKIMDPDPQPGLAVCSFLINRVQTTHFQSSNGFIYPYSTLQEEQIFYTKNNPPLPSES